MTTLPTDTQLITLAALCVCIAFMAGMLVQSIFLDFINRRAMRDAAADAFFDEHIGKDNGQ